MSGKPAARLGDSSSCPKTGHGNNPIASGSPDVFFDGLPAARAGDSTGCGSTLSSNLVPNVLINGKSAATLGSLGDHGSVVIGGSGTVIIGISHTPSPFVPPESLNIATSAHAMLASPALLAAGGDLGELQKQPTNWTAIGMFAVFVLATLWITKWAAARTKSVSDFYTAGGGITGFQNGLAIAGDYMSAASFLGISAAVMINGYDGLIYSIGFLVGWPIITFLLAEKLRNLGKFTFADVAAFRFEQTPVRLFAAISTLVVVAFYLIAQMVGAGLGVAALPDYMAHTLPGVEQLSDALPGCDIQLWLLTRPDCRALRSVQGGVTVGCELSASAVGGDEPVGLSFDTATVPAGRWARARRSASSPARPCRRAPIPC